MIDRATVKAIAALARLELSGDEVDRLTNDLGRITGYIDSLADAGVLDQVGAAPVAKSVADLREDEPRSSVRPELALSNAPASEAGYFKLPKIVE